MRAAPGQRPRSPDGFKPACVLKLSKAHSYGRNMSAGLISWLTIRRLHCMRCSRCELHFMRLPASLGTFTAEMGSSRKLHSLSDALSGL